MNLRPADGLPASLTLLDERDTRIRAPAAKILIRSVEIEADPVTWQPNILITTSLAADAAKKNEKNEG